MQSTEQRKTRNIRKHALFLKMPEEYYEYALQWCAYDHWTIEEAANLFTGCVPHRPMFLRGEDHVALDEEVLANENLIRAVLKTKLEVVRSRKYFEKTYIKSAEVMAWAKTCAALDLTDELIKAESVISHRYQSEKYTTPCIDAAKWVIENFWESANLREPPTSGAIIQALLHKYPDLSGVECDMIEKMTRHPLAKPID